MEIISIPETIKLLHESMENENYEKAYKLAENIDLEKKYVEGEYVFKNILEEFIFKVFIKKEIKKKNPLMFDYCSLYTDYGNLLLKSHKFDASEKSFNLAIKYNPINTQTLLGLAELEKTKENWEEFYKLSVKSIRYGYLIEDISQGFRNLAKYYLYLNKNNENKNKNDKNYKNKEENENNRYNKNNKFSKHEKNKNNEKIVASLIRISEEYDKDSKTAINDLKYLKNQISKEIKEEINNKNIDEIKNYLKSKSEEIPYEPSIEIITICKSLGFQLDESKKVVPALFYFNIAYKLSKDENIKDTIDYLNKKIERAL